MRTSAWLAATAVALVTSAGSVDAWAQPAPPPVAPPPAPAPPPNQAPAVAEGYTGPNRAMIGTGVLTVLVWYVPGAVIASGSRISSDASLFAPIVGPWIDLAGRPACGPGYVSCRVETGNQALLVLDGLFQAWGVGAAIVGVFVTERPRAAAATLQLAPARIGANGYGVTAIGSF